MKLKSTFAAALLIATIALSSSAVNAAKHDWDQAKNIRDSAGRLAQLHRAQGSPGVLKFLDACYRTHMLSSAYTEGLESCLAQDYMHTQVLASIYARLAPEARAKMRVPSPDALARGMGQRFLVAFTQYKVSPADAEDFKKLVDRYGFPIFLKAVFPTATAPADPPAGRRVN